MTRPNHLFILLSLLCASLAGLLFVPGLSGGFVFDDRVNIVESTALHITSLDLQSLRSAAFSFQPGGGSRPLAELTFALDYWRSGLNPSAFKTTNLVIHGLTTVALAMFFRLLLLKAGSTPKRTILVPLGLALAWAVHPLQVSSVLYVVQRMQTLGTLFLVLALWTYLKMRLAQSEGSSSRHFGLLTVLLWALALASKEDSALLPAYTLALELTVLRFEAKDAAISRLLRWSYLLLTVAGAVVFLVIVLPHHWHWDAYPGRSFSSLERLLTQARVLSMYLGQILLPLPDRLHFYYDDIQPSRGLWQPLSTLPSLALVIGLLASAWWCRKSRPILSFGLFVFFAGHFISSNIINLELAFEHRNHLPLIGIVLAAGDLITAAFQRMRTSKTLALLICSALLIMLGTATVIRADTWGNTLIFAQKSTEIAPASPRAWLALGGFYAELSGMQRGNPALDEAIRINQEGAQLTGAPALLANVVLYKSIQGNVTQSDWDIFLKRLLEAPMDAQNTKILWVTLDSVANGIPLDERGVLRTIEIVASRATLASSEYMRIGAYLHNDTMQPEKALHYLRRAVELSPPGDPDVTLMYQQLREAGHADWVNDLKRAKRSK